ncbi:hypothetical protein Bca52824_021975 [Brassica carinata]|uniref:Uncharacterized protein n=1 Tax=Brassica carinata TaxID=52824 RepID=A0A8X8ASP9_BRACI|nr:hypothetical protein Bca52824_021975 [Brassica carinata]
MVVADLLVWESKEWNTQMIGKVFPHLMDEIRLLKPSVTGGRDIGLYGWDHEMESILRDWGTMLQQNTVSISTEEVKILIRIGKKIYGQDVCLRRYKSSFGKPHKELYQ